MEVGSLEMLSFLDLKHGSPIREAASLVAKERYAPLAGEWDTTRALFPQLEREYLASLGYLGMTLPKEYGGEGARLLDALEVLEEFGKCNLAAAFQIFEANTGPIRAIQMFGTPEQKEFYISKVVAGTGTVSVAISEPDAGSAATDLTTTAIVSGPDILINGVKRWCSGAGHSEYYVVYVRFEGASSGLGAVVVHRDDPGVSFGPRESLHGFRSIATADIILEDLRLPVSRVLPVSFKDLLSVFSIERLGNATMSLATAQASFEHACEFVSARRQFGRILLDFQEVHTRLARMAVEIDSARLLIFRAAMRIFSSQDLPNTIDASMAKLKSNRVAVEVSQAAMELMGGYGYHSEFEVERLHRDAHGWAVAGGTATMQEIRIASELFGRKFNQRVFE